MKIFNKVIPSLFLFLLYFQPVMASDFRSFTNPKQEQLTFDYSPDQIEYLKHLPKPQERITPEMLKNLRKEVSYLIYTTELSGIDQTIIPSYLANAQKDFAWLSYLITGEYTGCLEPVTLWIVQLFIPDAVLPNVKESAFDVYSSSLASIVVAKAAERLQEERQEIADYPIKRGNGLWKPTSPGYTGLNFGSAKTWFLSSSKQYVAKAPPERVQFWKDECDQIRAEQQNLNGQKVKAVYEWAGLTSMNAGNWEKIFDEYLDKNNFPVGVQLYTRAVLLSALADSNAASFNSKYSYWVMRPSQRNPEVKPLVTVPNHPSYPSAHSTISGTAATVLCELFPQDSKKWNALAEEAGMSRIWGGIHYPVDHKEGLKLGEEVGSTVLQKVSQKNSRSPQ